MCDVLAYNRNRIEQNSHFKWVGVLSMFIYSPALIMLYLPTFYCVFYCVLFQINFCWLDLELGMESLYLYRVIRELWFKFSEMMGGSQRNF